MEPLFDQRSGTFRVLDQANMTFLTLPHACHQVLFIYLIVHNYLLSLPSGIFPRDSWLTTTPTSREPPQPSRIFQSQMIQAPPMKNSRSPWSCLSSPPSTTKPGGTGCDPRWAEAGWEGGVRWSWCFYWLSHTPLRRRRPSKLSTCTMVTSFRCPTLNLTADLHIKPSLVWSGPNYSAARRGLWPRQTTMHPWILTCYLHNLRRSRTAFSPVQASVATFVRTVEPGWGAFWRSGGLTRRFDQTNTLIISISWFLYIWV